MKEHVAINDFVICEPTVGRNMLSPARRWLLDRVCALTGHLLWRVQNSRREFPGDSLPLQTSLCRRCGQGGYVQGDYFRNAAQ